MRRRLAGRLSKWAIAVPAIVGVALIVDGGEARVGDAAVSGGHLERTLFGVPHRWTPVLVTAPPAVVRFDAAEPAEPLAGLEARTRAATAAAAVSGADIETVVLDRATGELVSNGVSDPIPIASVAKLFIADDLLLRESQGETTLSAADDEALERMLQSSDDGAAQDFWDRSGGSVVIDRIVARYGLTSTTAPENGHWDVTLSTAGDLVRYYATLLNGGGGLGPEQANTILENLARFTPTGTDGYPQRFGIPDGLFAEPVAVKQGWFCCWNGADQLHLSTGAIGPDRRYVMAIGSLDPDDAAVARSTVTEAVKTMFPGGRI